MDAYRIRVSGLQYKACGILWDKKVISADGEAAQRGNWELDLIRFCPGHRQPYAPPPQAFILSKARRDFLALFR